MKNVQTIIDLFGGLGWLRSGNWIRLENEPYMRLVIEYVCPGPRGLPTVSVAHYYEQNGDAMRDPEITFEIDDAGAWHPTSYLQDNLGVYQEIVSRDDAGRLVVKPKLLKDLKAFCNLWDNNIGEQGFVDVARRLVSERAAAD